jgi:hypothetical protein
MSIQYLIKTKLYSLTKVDNPKTGRRHYVISIPADYHPMLADATKLHKHFDPTKCRTLGGRGRWKFKTKEEAKELLSLAILKGLL